ncbi:hypothetical protein LINPERHAP1_LOCUS18134, partial [Linum perenne]
LVVVCCIIYIGKKGGNTEAWRWRWCVLRPQSTTHSKLRLGEYVKTLHSSGCPRPPATFAGRRSPATFAGCRSPASMTFRRLFPVPFFGDFFRQLFR